MKAIEVVSVFLYLAHLSAAVPINKFYTDINSDYTRADGINSSDIYHLSTNFPFYGVNNTALYVNKNGVISFKQPFSDSSPRSFPLNSIEQLIAPFWTNVNSLETGTVWYGETTKKHILSRAMDDIQKLFGRQGIVFKFQPQFVFLATWDRVGFSNPNNNQTNTFQCVLASDGSLSFVIFLYADEGIQWTKGDASDSSLPAQIGVNAGDGNRSASVPKSLTDEIVNVTLTSNVGIPGMWIFQVSGPLVKNTASPDRLHALTSKSEAPSLLFDSNTVINSINIQREVNSLALSGKGFIVEESGKIIQTTEEQVTSDKLSPQQTAAVSLPASLFQQIVDHKVVGPGISLVVHRKPVFFGIEKDSSPYQTVVGSNVLAISAGGLQSRFERLAGNVTSIFHVPFDKFVKQGSEQCASLSQNVWTTEFCTTNLSQLENEIVICNCKEVRNFAILVDICLRLDDCDSQLLDPRFDHPLTYFSYVGISVSILSLIATVVTYLIHKELRKKDISKYHIQLSLAMTLMLLVNLMLLTLSDKNISEPYGVCVTVSTLVHYFSLTAVMWMGAEALLMFQKLVLVFRQITRRFIVVVSVICWTIPIISVVIPLSVELAIGRNSSTDITVREDNSTLCFLSHIGAFWGSFLGPIFAILIFNVIMFICVIIVLVRHAIRRRALRNEAVNRKAYVNLIIGISGVTFLFGLTWLFAVFTFFESPKLKLRESFQLLFTVFNSLQGFAIFVFLCLFNRDARNCWIELICCRKSQKEYPDRIGAISRAHRENRRVEPNSNPHPNREGSDRSNTENQLNDDNARLVHKEERQSRNELDNERSHDSCTERTHLLTGADSDSQKSVQPKSSTTYGVCQSRAENGLNFEEN